MKEVRVLKEADGLETIGAIGISREFSFNGEKYIWNNSPKSSLSMLKKHSNTDYFTFPIAKRLSEEKVKFTKFFCNQFSKETELTN
jgi:HD superfamily phosphodiesterase